MVDEGGFRSRWDIFCRLVDNMGDIGVCWRLARSLAVHHGRSVRLWVDELDAFYRLCPGAPRSASRSLFEGVEVLLWQVPFPQVHPADVVIEAFACDPPSSYIEAMARRERQPLWINLEYLSAEPWVAECHLRHSPHPRLGLDKVFFFPGFVPGTGGLLREPDLLGARDRFRSDPNARDVFLRALGCDTPSRDTRVVSLFAYAQPDLASLLESWARGERPVLLLVPEGRVVADVRAWFDGPCGEAAALVQRGRLQLRFIPFLSQVDYDRLLWSCDLNFVRGEDSFVRAQWAGAPFAWHIYRQADDAHRIKLDAFLCCFCDGLDPAAATALRAFWQAWNGFGSVAETWPGFAAALPALRRHGERWAQHLGARPDLATELVKLENDAVKCQVFQSRMPGGERP